MLEGWAMLADECPNHECYGIPLVRPPRTGEDKGLRKASAFRSVESNTYVSVGVRDLWYCVRESSR